MRKVRIIIFVIIGLALIITAAFFIIGYLVPKGAGISIKTNPQSNVFIEGEQVGHTPYKATRKPSEVTVKLVPESFDKPLAPYETKVTLVSGVETAIRRDFGEVEEKSSGEIVSFEKADDKESSLAVISVPDEAQVTIDGQVRGFAPYKSSLLSVGEHTLLVGKEGYSERNLSIKTYSGYKLTAYVNLAKKEGLVENSATTNTPTANDDSDSQDKVQILDTPTGYLRVRSEPSTSSNEMARVDPGKTYKLLAEDDATGWFKIEIEKDKEGWITKQYAKKIAGQSPNNTPTPSPKATLTPTKKPTPTPSE